MAEFNMKIAGHTAAVRSLFESTPHYFRPYLTQDTPEFSIAVTWADVEYERNFCAEEARLEGFRFRDFPDTYLERAAVQRKFTEYLFDYDILLFHGSAVAVDGEGYLFTAKSGTGKSTHTRLWRELFGSRAVMVNDDKPFVHITRDGVRIFGSPWSGKHGLNANIDVPLKGICILERGKENRIRKLVQENAMDMLFKQAIPPMDPDKLSHYRELVNALAGATQLWHMTCNKEPEAAQAAYDAMSCNQSPLAISG